MDKQQILEEARELIGLAKGVISRCETVITEANLAEAENPEYRSGDYGMGCKGHFFALCGSGSDTKAAIDNGEVERWGENSENYCYNEATCLGNIFDDLKAMAEDVEEFEVDNGTYMSLKVSWNGNKIRIGDGGGFVLIDHHEIPAFILNLRRLQATHERKQNAANTH